MGVIVKTSHLRKLKYCSRGQRRFFEQHNLNFLDFIKNGISEEELIKTNDSMAFKAIEEAKKGE